jgi:hypothetical protein
MNVTFATKSLLLKDNMVEKQNQEIKCDKCVEILTTKEKLCAHQMKKKNVIFSGGGDAPYQNL